MSEEKTETAQDVKAPIFRVQKMYVKDLSFENPNAPDVFLERETEPKVDVNLSLRNKKLQGEDSWEVGLSITAKITNSKTDKTLFIIEVEHAGVFLLQNIPEEHLPAVLGVECPALLFPFTRQIISQVSVDGGFIPFLMEPVNFLALYENAKRKQQAAQSAEPQQ